MAADPAVLLGGEAAGIVRQLRFLVHIHTAKGALLLPVVRVWAIFLPTCRVGY